MTEQEKIEIFRQFTDFDNSELKIIMPYFEHKRFKKKTTLLDIGKVSNEVFYLIKGCIRLYCERDGEELSTYFFTENMFAGSYDSFLSRKPSKVAIETLEECDVLVLSHKGQEKLYEIFPKMNEFIRKAIEQRFVLLHDLFISYLLNSPEERYLMLLKDRPELLQRFPQHQIASYLGVTPVSLSRIRNRVNKK
ncbi:MAG: Crp/Fnr family transcriptional regulator [Saprospiraceae bacterium]|nr:Crp/Fnr family transcriptional regulator [Saprospiraceae bacterium]HMW38716.1 Crp/Fnr family transcriptional regulator [Saprospiraceae bacterium]HMZ40032.1 Crp/Fnr family transcriptional regulator [Saprospiraceae bacterium]HNA64422.1 Crp/Fnr family transcriptional regulator [Saprospiraceae bacterium]HNB31731.1 Crp/Fnr family transcriptional regulator [Saprospiraceae bacterium]